MGPAQAPQQRPARMPGRALRARHNRCPAAARQRSRVSLAGSTTATLLHLALGAVLLKRLHALLARLLGGALHHGEGEVGHGVLGLLQAQRGQRAHGLDGSDLLRAVHLGDHEVELGLLRRRLARIAARSRSRHHHAAGRGRRVNAEGLLDRGHELRGLEQGEGLELLDDLVGGGRRAGDLARREAGRGGRRAAGHLRGQRHAGDRHASDGHLDGLG
mmetsp:Transcript_12145/g.51122  ORF Transcript_12145/g.51122 Transcript_12145/m.51122 type:complete len:217 (+) Transcript_12145:38-688(+)